MAGLDKNAAARRAQANGVWYRFRYLVYALLSANAAMVCYAVFYPEQFTGGGGGKSLKVKPRNEGETKQAEKEKVVSSGEEKKSVEQGKKPPMIHRAVSKEEQIELYKWMLDEKRKAKPSGPEEKARIEREKSLLKDYIRGKTPSL